MRTRRWSLLVGLVVLLAVLYGAPQISNPAIQAPGPDLVSVCIVEGGIGHDAMVLQAAAHILVNRGIATYDGTCGRGRI